MSPVLMAGHANMASPAIGSCETKLAVTQATRLGHVLAFSGKLEHCFADKALLLHWLGQ